jgi:hypothetical protein
MARTVMGSEILQAGFSTHPYPIFSQLWFRMASYKG